MILNRIGSHLRRLSHSVRHPNVRHSRIEDFSQIDPSAKINNSQIYGQIVLGRCVIVDDCRISANCPVSVDDYSILSGPITIVADINPISIGKFGSIAPEVVLRVSSHNIARITSYCIFNNVLNEGFERDIVSKGAIKVGNDVWIGTKAVILSGVTIGDGAVIGAGSIVTKNIPPYSVAAGVPAAVIKFRFSQSICKRLLELQWWNWDEDRIKRNRALFEDEVTSELLDRAVKE